MRDRLKQYIEQLFMRAPRTQSAQELKEEMLQNLLDKYDDLIAEGKSEEDAYRLAVAGIGDVSGLIGSLEPQPAAFAEGPSQQEPRQKNAVVMAAAITLYVLSVIPNFLFGNAFGVVLMFALIAAATAMLIMNRTNVHPMRMTLVGIGVALLIMCPAPTIIIHNVLGVVLLFVLIGAGVGLIVYGRTEPFNTVPAEAEDGDDGGKAALPRASKIGYAALAAILLIFLLGAALSTSIRHDKIAIHGLNGEIIGGADGSTEIAVGEDFEQRIEDAIDEKIDDNLGDSIEESVESAFGRPGDHDDDHDDDDDDDRKAGKTDGNKNAGGAAATASIMEGAAEVPATGITEIEVDWVGGDVNISNHGGDTIAISETSKKALTDKQKLRYTVKGNKLSISYCEDTLFVWDWLDIDRLSMPAKTLTLQLPAGPLPELEINSVSAKVFVQGIDFDELDIESVSGDVQVADVTGRKLSVQTTSGKTDVRGADVTKLDLETTSGRIDVSGSQAIEANVETISASSDLQLLRVPEKLEIETVSGKTTLTLPKDATDFSVQMETVSGNFDCGFACTRQNGRYTAGSGAYRYEFTSVSGDFEIVAG